MAETKEVAVDAARSIDDKTNQLLDMAIAGLNKTGDVILDAGNVLSKYAQELGPDVLNMLLAVVRLNGLGEVLMGLMYIAGSVGCYFFVTRKAIPWCKNEQVYEAIGGFQWLGLTIFCVFALVMFIKGLARVVDVWNWAQIFYPEVFIARELLERVIQ